MKGQISKIGIAVAATVVSILILSVAMDTGDSIKDKIRIETIDVIGERVGSTISMTSSIDEGRVQMNFKEEYGINEKKDSFYVNYSAGGMALSVIGQTGESELVTPVSFSAEEGVSDSFCVIKEPGRDAELIPEEC